MKLILLLACLLTSLPSYSFTLNNNIAAAFSKDEVVINMASNTDCSSTGLTNDEILSLAGDAASTFWNTVATSRVSLSMGSLQSVSSKFETDTICSSGINADCVPNPDLKVSENILVACNTNSTNFSSSSYVMAVALPNNISGTTIVGSLVLINATGSTSTNVFGNSSRAEQISILAHEFGHALGLGHSGVTDSLMYFQSIEKRLALGWDDIQGITYLYPQEQPISCGSVAYTNQSNHPTALTSLAVFLLLLLITQAFKFRFR